MPQLLLLLLVGGSSVRLPDQRLSVVGSSVWWFLLGDLLGVGSYANMYSPGCSILGEVPVSYCWQIL